MRTPLTFADRLINAHRRRGPRATSGLAFACVAALPLSAWGVVEGLRGSYSTWVDARFHPQVPGYPLTAWSNSGPDYPYDASAIAICGLLFCVAATALLLLALAALLAQRRDRLTPPTR